jgi:hypothetical protein
MLPVTTAAKPPPLLGFWEGIPYIELQSTFAIGIRYFKCCLSNMRFSHNLHTDRHSLRTKTSGYIDNRAPSHNSFSSKLVDHEQGTGYHFYILSYNSIVFPVLHENHRNAGLKVAEAILAEGASGVNDFMLRKIPAL